MSERHAVYFVNGFSESDVVRTVNFLRYSDDPRTGLPCGSTWHTSRKQWYLYFWGPGASDAQERLKVLLKEHVAFNSRGEITRIDSKDIEGTSTWCGGRKFFTTVTAK